jgi:predicted transcriptional regulator
MSTTVKDRILESLEQLPASATVEYAMERLYFLSKVERGLQDLEAGHTVSHADVKARYAR